MWKGQFDALFALIFVLALLFTGYIGNNTGNWSLLAGTVGVLLGFWVLVQILNFLSKAFTGKPILYEGIIDEKRKRR